MGIFNLKSPTKLYNFAGPDAGRCYNQQVCKFHIRYFCTCTQIFHNGIAAVYATTDACANGDGVCFAHQWVGFYINQMRFAAGFFV